MNIPTPSALLEQTDSFPQQQVDLSRMTKPPHSTFEVNGKHWISFCSNDNEYLCTKKAFSLPLMIRTRVKTDHQNIRLYYHRGEVILNWECNEPELRYHDPLTGNNNGYNGRGKIAENQWHDIIWILQKEYMAIVVDGEIRYCGIDSDYHHQWDKASSLRAGAGVGSAWNSTVTVESFAVASLSPTPFPWGSLGSVTAEALLSSLTIQNEQTFSSMDMELAVKPLDQSVITETGMQMGFAPDEFLLEDPIVHTAPIRIDARVQTQGGLRIFYNYGMLVFGDMWYGEYLHYTDPLIAGHHYDCSMPPLSPDDFHDITWIIHREYWAVIVDGNMVLYRKNMPYQQQPDASLSGKLTVGVSCGTITVSRLTVRELI